MFLENMVQMILFSWTIVLFFIICVPAAALIGDVFLFQEKSTRQRILLAVVGIVGWLVEVLILTILVTYFGE